MPRWSYLFVTGRPGAARTIDGDTLYVDCPDTYESLPQKTLHLVRYLVEETDAEYLLKTDDDCYVNVPRLKSIRHWNRDYFGTRSGETGHSRDYHFGKTSTGSLQDTTPYLGPWAHGTGYCISRKGCQWLVDNLRRETVLTSIYEDKMIGDAFRFSPLACQLHAGFNAFKLDNFCHYRLDAERNVISQSIELLREDEGLGNYATYHLGARGNAIDPVYRVDEATMAELFERLEAHFGRALASSALAEGRTTEAPHAE